MSLFGKFENIFYIQKFRHCILGDSAPNISPLLVRKKCQWIPLPGNRARTSYHHTVHNLVPMKQFYILYLTNSDAKKWLVKIIVSFSSLQIHMANQFSPFWPKCSGTPHSVPLCVYEYYHSASVLCTLVHLWILLPQFPCTLWTLDMAYERHLADGLFISFFT